MIPPEILRSEISSLPPGRPQPVAVGLLSSALTYEQAQSREDLCWAACLQRGCRMQQQKLPPSPTPFWTQSSPPSAQFHPLPASSRHSEFPYFWPAGQRREACKWGMMDTTTLSPSFPISGIIFKQKRVDYFLSKLISTDRSGLSVSNNTAGHF